MRSRWYAPAIARFIQPDVAPADNLDTRTLNRYVYSLNDPVDRFDPSGRTNLAELSFYSAVVFTLTGVTSIVLADPQEVAASGFGLGNVKKHWAEREDAHILPFGASGSLGVTRAGKVGLSGGMTANIEMLYFDKLKKGALYFSFGSEFGVGVGTPDLGPPGLGANGQTQGGIAGGLGSGPVYNTPEPQHYQGWFVNLSASAGVSLSAELGANKNLTGGSGIGGTIFWSPTPTYAIYPKDPDKTPLPTKDIKSICPGCEYRYGHGLKYSIAGGVSASISLTLTFWLL
jgi:hypothetical protein